MLSFSKLLHSSSPIKSNLPNLSSSAFLDRIAMLNRKLLIELDETCFVT